MVTDDLIRETKLMPLKEIDIPQIKLEKKIITFPHVSQISAVSLPMQRYQLISIKEEMAFRESIGSSAFGKISLPKKDR